MREADPPPPPYVAAMMQQFELNRQFIGSLVDRLETTMLVRSLARSHFRSFVRLNPVHFPQLI